MSAKYELCVIIIEMYFLLKNKQKKKVPITPVGSVLVIIIIKKKFYKTGFSYQTDSNKNIKLFRIFHAPKSLNSNVLQHESLT